MPSKTIFTQSFAKVRVSTESSSPRFMSPQTISYLKPDSVAKVRVFTNIPFSYPNLFNQSPWRHVLSQILKGQEKVCWLIRFVMLL